MPVGVIVMCCMSGCGLMPLFGMVEMSSFCVNTDWKCWLSMLALGGYKRWTNGGQTVDKRWTNDGQPMDK